VRLADHAFETGVLSEDAIEAAVGVMERFRDAMADREVRHYRAVATSAVRESANRRALVRKVRERKFVAFSSASVSGLVTTEFDRIGISRFFSIGSSCWPV
jgi:hypothetical protein